jgi:hypothetical protein
MGQKVPGGAERGQSEPSRPVRHAEPGEADKRLRERSRAWGRDGRKDEQESGHGLHKPWPRGQAEQLKTRDDAQIRPPNREFRPAWRRAVPSEAQTPEPGVAPWRRSDLYRDRPR